MKISINKKAQEGEKYLSVWMIFIWLIIIVFIVIAVTMFYSVESDVRKIEASALALRLADCMNSNFDYSVVTAKDFNIYAFCNLSKEVIETPEYYFNLTFIRQPDNSAYSIYGGNRDFGVQCAYQANANNKKEENFAQCYRAAFFMRDLKSNVIYQINIEAASNSQTLGI